MTRVLQGCTRDGCQRRRVAPEIPKWFNDEGAIEDLMGELIEVATLSDLPPGSCQQVDAAGRPVALFNVNGTIYAIRGACTHLGGPLGEGELDGPVVTCPWHGAQFDVTTGQVVGPPAPQSVPTYRVVVAGDVIKVEVT